MSIKCVFGFHKWHGCKCSVCGRTRDKQFRTALWNAIYWADPSLRAPEYMRSLVLLRTSTQLTGFGPAQLLMSRLTTGFVASETLLQSGDISSSENEKVLRTWAEKVLIPLSQRHDLVANDAGIVCNQIQDVYRWCDQFSRKTVVGQYDPASDVYPVGSAVRITETGCICWYGGIAIIPIVVRCGFFEEWKATASEPVAKTRYPTFVGRKGIVVGAGTYDAADKDDDRPVRIVRLESGEIIVTAARGLKSP